jgi:hypothetical protein
MAFLVDKVTLWQFSVGEFSFMRVNSRSTNFSYSITYSRGNKKYTNLKGNSTETSSRPTTSIEIPVYRDLEICSSCVGGFLTWSEVYLRQIWKFI